MAGNLRQWQGSSSSVSMMKYNRDTQKLIVEYHGGQTGIYEGVPDEVVTNIFNSKSVGTAIWDNIRIRGTVHGHQYPYRVKK